MIFPHSFSFSVVKIPISVLYVEVKLSSILQKMTNACSAPMPAELCQWKVHFLSKRCTLYSNKSVLCDKWRRHTEQDQLFNNDTQHIERSAFRWNAPNIFNIHETSVCFQPLTELCLFCHKICIKTQSILKAWSFLWRFYTSPYNCIISILVLSL